MTQYVIYEIDRDKVKEVIKKCKKIFGTASWKDTLYIEKNVPFYIFTNKDSALKEVRKTNRCHLESIKFYIELESYDD